MGRGLSRRNDHPFLLGEGLTIGPGLTTDTGAKASATPRLLTGNDVQPNPNLSIDQTWSFTDSTP